MRGISPSKDSLAAAGFMLPLVAVIAVFVLLPVAGTIWSSFFRDVTYLKPGWVGPANFGRLVHDGAFRQSLGFTAVFLAVSVPIEMALGTAFALVLNEKLPLRNPLRALALIPWAVPTIVAARTWEMIYNYSYGLANYLGQVTHLSAAPINWLGSPGSAFAALVVADVWKTTPFVAIIVLAGLQTIPETVYEQAKVDGARFDQRFLRLTLPILKPVLVVALIFRSIDALRILDLIYVLTDGGPGGSTTSLSLYGYKYFNEGDFGYGSAIAVTVFVLAFVLSVVYLKAGGFARTTR